MPPGFSFVRQVKDELHPSQFTIQKGWKNFNEGVVKAYLHIRFLLKLFFKKLERRIRRHTPTKSTFSEKEDLKAPKHTSIIAFAHPVSTRRLRFLTRYLWNAGAAYTGRLPVGWQAMVFSGEPPPLHIAEAAFPVEQPVGMGPLVHGADAAEPTEHRAPSAVSNPLSAISCGFSYFIILFLLFTSLNLTSGSTHQTHGS